MKPGLRLTLLVLLLACGAALVASLYVARVRSPLHSTLTSSFQLLGTPVKFLDRMASRVVPVSALDERELGDTFRKRYDTQVTAGDADQAYLDALMAEIKAFTRRPFPYRAYVVGYFGAPNAMALPGGVILVTKELLSTLHSESELVAVLAHEVGHIERGHCFDTIRFQLLTRKIGSDTLGALADAAAQILLRHAYSKTTEGEADEYAYELLVSSRYDPLGVGKSFGSLRRYVKNAEAQTPQHAHPIRDYFMSHPPLEIREAEFRERAAMWWKRRPGERRYVGQQNLFDRKALGTLDVSGEWASGAGLRR
jgi:beta-barrel assembly-enhancing protease